MRRKFILILLVFALFGGVCAARAAEMAVFDIGEANGGVRLLQAELRALGYLSEEPDGVYGAATAMAVAAYNAANGIAAGDIVAGESAGLATCVSLHRALEGNAPLDVGSRSSAVYALQKLLYTAGFLSESPDGVFGDDTKRAARAYMDYAAEDMAAFAAARAECQQTQLCSVVRDDGMPVAVDIPIISPATVVTDGAVSADWLDYMLKGAAPKAPIAQRGDKGEGVARVQKRLIALGYLATGADGSFGENTRLALCYFQRRNGLPETGSCDWATQQALFSEGAAASDQTVSQYKAYVSTRKNKVYIARWTGAGYDERVKTFTCTTGAGGTPTIKGTFHATGQAGSWYHMKKSNCWVRYAFVINGNYFFHSVLFKNKGDAKPTSSSVRNLGKNASHGCIRMAVEDVKWIYDNCSPGMTVVIE